jgi:hypothetical protein
MSKFRKGDVIRVVQITDIDAELTDPKRVLTDPTDPLTFDWQDPPQTLIGQVGRVVEPFLNDYYDCIVDFPWCRGYDYAAMAFKEADLVLHPRVGDKVKVTVPHLCRFGGIVTSLDEHDVVVTRIDDGSQTSWPLGQVEVVL